MTRIGVYPGTFDPLTLGHMDIIRRGAKLVDKLVIGVATNPSKSPMFTLAERCAQVSRETAFLGDAVEVVQFDALLMHFADAQAASMIIRGLRAVADFEYDFQMAGMNKLVKEIAMYGGDIHRFVPGAIADEVVARVAAIQH